MPGCRAPPLDDLKGGEPAHNAARCASCSAARKGPLRDIVLLNSAAALIVADRAETLRDGVAAGGPIHRQRRGGRQCSSGWSRRRTGERLMDNVLTEICDRKREHVAARKAAMPEATLRKRLGNAPPPRGFAKALARRSRRRAIRADRRDQEGLARARG